MVFDSVIYSYGNNKVLRGIYLKIPHGSIVGIFGINGSGKSTLIKIGAGLLQPDNGSIFINDKYFGKTKSISRYNHIAYLPQDSFLPADLKIKDLEKHIPGLRKFIDKDPVLKILRDQKISHLSGGELRYLEINLLFSLDREYYLLDEPFTGVEPNLIEKTCLLLDVQKRLGKGILLTDHYYRYVTEIIERAYLLKNGYCCELNNNDSFRTELIENGYLGNR